MPDSCRSKAGPLTRSTNRTDSVDEQARVVFVVDSDRRHSIELRAMLEGHGYEVETFADSTSFLATHQSGRRGCLLVDVSMHEVDGIELIKTLRSADCGLAMIAMTTQFMAPMVVHAMKAGASDCLQKPIVGAVLANMLLEVINERIAFIHASAFRALAVQRMATLTARQHEVLELITTGHPSKNIAADLRISQRTVENHRAAIARKTCSRSLSDVIHTAICANCSLMVSAPRTA